MKFIPIFLLLFLSCQEEQKTVKVLDNSQTRVSVSTLEDGVLDFGIIKPGEVKCKTFQLHSQGGLRSKIQGLDGLSFPFQFSGDGLPGLNGTCDKNKDYRQGESCLMELCYTPSIEGKSETMVGITFNNGIENDITPLSLKGQAIQDAILLAALGVENDKSVFADNHYGSHEFEQLNVGQSEPLLLSIFNIGGRDAVMDTSYNFNTHFNFTGNSYPGINGNCSSIIAPKQICQIEVEFRPTTKGNAFIEGTLGYFDGDDLQQMILTLTGSAIDVRAKIVVANGVPSSFFGEVALGRTQELSIGLVNSQLIDATDITVALISGEFRFKGGAYPGTGGTCSTSLEARGVCQMILEYTPTVLGESSAIISFNYNDNNAFDPQVDSVTHELIGEGLSPGNLVLDMTSSTPTSNPQIFPVRAVNSGVTHTLVFRNNGQVTIKNLTQGTFTTPFSRVGGSCGTTKTSLAPDAICTLLLRFQSSVAGTFNESFQLDFNNGIVSSGINASTIINMQAQAEDVANLRFDIAAQTNGYSFPKTSQGQNLGPLTVTLTNTGGSSATGISFSNTALLSPIAVSNDTCSTELAAGASCTFDISLDATNIGSNNRTYTVSFNDFFGAHTQNFSLTYEVASLAQLSYRDDSGALIPDLDFGEQATNQSYEKILRLRNTGGFNATSVNFSFSSPDFNVAQGNCTTVNNNDTCDYVIRFSPTSVGAKSTSVSLSYFNGESTINAPAFTIQGTGANVGHLRAQGMVSGVSYNFGDQQSGLTHDFTISIENIGLGDAVIDSLGLILAPFTVQSDLCTGQTLPQGATCDIDLRFSPTVGNQTYNRDIRLDYTAGTTNKFFQLTFHMRSLNPVNLNLNFVGSNVPDGHDYGKVAIGLSEDLSFQLSNLGQVALDASLLTIGLSNISDMPYSLVDNFCAASELPPTGLGPNQTCNFKVRFAPGVDKVFDVSTLTINHTQHTEQTLPFNVDLNGEGDVPLATFERYKMIKVTSDATSATLHLKWQAMSLPPPLTIDSYRVYMQTSGPMTLANIGLGTAVLENIDPTDPEAIITGLDLGKTYYLTIRPLYTPTLMAKVTDEVLRLKIITPPKHMALIHRWQANIDQCLSMGAVPDKTRDFKCDFTGFGKNVDDEYDFGKHLMVDRYETSLSNLNLAQNLPNKDPIVFVTQVEANTRCQNMSESVDGVSQTKRLLQRQEFVVAAKWDDALTLQEVEDLEEGVGSTACVLNRDEPLRTGIRSDCVSKYGVFDIVGNVWEWNSDQISAGYGAASGLDPTNVHSAGFPYAVLVDGLIRSKQCFNYALGYPMDRVGGQCVGSSNLIVSQFDNDFYWTTFATGTFGVRSGGGVGYSFNPYGNVSGRYSFNAEVTPFSKDLSTGLRCTFSLSP